MLRGKNCKIYMFIYVYLTYNILL